MLKRLINPFLTWNRGKLKFDSSSNGITGRLGNRSKVIFWIVRVGTAEGRWILRN